MVLANLTRRVFGVSTALAAFSVALVLTEPSHDAEGQALMVLEFVPGPSSRPTGAAAGPESPPPTSIAAAPPTSVGRVAATANPTSTAPSAYGSDGRERCVWSWDALRGGDGSLENVTIILEAPRRPHAPVTMTAKPGASPPKTHSTTTDGNGFASMVLTLGSDPRDWTLEIDASFAGTSCAAPTFTITL